MKPVVVRWLLAVAALFPFAAGADTVASLLGNFTVNQYCDVRIEQSTIGVGYVVVFGQLPALRELHLADANGDGVTTQDERDAYVAKLAPDFARDLVLTVDGTRVPLTAMRWTTSLPTEASGFSMRLEIEFEGALPASAHAAPTTVRFENTNYANQLGWHEIVVHAAASIRVFDTDAHDSSLTNRLNDALSSLPASGPLDERTIDLRFAPEAAVPPGSRLIAARGEAPAVSANDARTAPIDTGSTLWLQTQTRRLVGLISAPQVSFSVLALALLAALVLGALHAFSPGHGKTIVGAYLIGSRSTARHAVILGVTVTITHTLVVFAVGLATLFASRYILPERLFPALSLLSGLLVLGMGVVLLRQRWPAAHRALGRQLVRWYEGAQPAVDTIAVSTAGRSTLLKPLPARAGAVRYGMRPTTVRARAHAHDGHPHSHDHVHRHGHEHAHEHGTAGLHSHGGGSMHSHLPPGAGGERVTMKSLLALGVSGGLVPCPSAMVLLLAAIALNKTYYGLMMVIAFSVGLALTLIAVGMAFLYARQKFSGRMRVSNLTDLLPAASSVFITLIGLFLCYGALTSTGLSSLKG